MIQHGRGMGYGRGRGLGLGPSGFCICPKCGNKIVHQRGIPCNQQRCPVCGSTMIREGIETKVPPSIPHEYYQKDRERRVIQPSSIPAGTP